MNDVFETLRNVGIVSLAVFGILFAAGLAINLSFWVLGVCKS